MQWNANVYSQQFTAQDHCHCIHWLLKIHRLTQRLQNLYIIHTGCNTVFGAEDFTERWCIMFTFITLQHIHTQRPEYLIGYFICKTWRYMPFGYFRYFFSWIPWSLAKEKKKTRKFDLSHAFLIFYLHHQHTM